MNFHDASVARRVISLIIWTCGQGSFTNVILHKWINNPNAFFTCHLADKRLYFKFKDFFAQWNKGLNGISPRKDNQEGCRETGAGIQRSCLHMAFTLISFVTMKPRPRFFSSPLRHVRTAGVTSRAAAELFARCWFTLKYGFWVLQSAAG